MKLTHQQQKQFDAADRPGKIKLAASLTAGKTLDLIRVILEKHEQAALETMLALQEEVDALENENNRLRETLQGIAGANLQEWEEGYEPRDFVEWAKSRANHALSASPSPARTEGQGKKRKGLDREIAPY